MSIIAISKCEKFSPPENDTDIYLNTDAVDGQWNALDRQSDIITRIETYHTVSFNEIKYNANRFCNKSINLIVVQKAFPLKIR